VIALTLIAPSLARADLVTTNVVQATDPGKSTAVVNYTPPTATTDGVPILGGAPCTPPPGSKFALGVTAVSCSAIGMQTCDPNFDPTCITGIKSVPEPGSFTVTIFDGGAPTLAQPPDVSAATAPGVPNVAVTYPTPAASDNVGVTSLVCAPASGTLFGVGSTPVTCTARDAAGNSTSKTFHVSVTPTPPAASTAKDQCVVPRLIGKKLKAAKTALTAAHCKLGKVAKKKLKKSSRTKRGIVVKQSPAAGTTKAAGSKVNVTVGA